MTRHALLLPALVLLAHVAHAEPASDSVCVEALEQLKTLQTLAPVYKLVEGRDRRYLADANRPAELARLQSVIAASCSAEPKSRQRQDSEAEQLHRVRSPGCIEDRDRLSIMEKKESRTPQDDLEKTRLRVEGQCPKADLSNVWLVQWVPPPAPNG